MLKKKLLILFLSFFIGLSNVWAEELEVNKIPDYYINYNGEKYEMLMLKEKESNTTLFSISPYQSVKSLSLSSKLMSAQLFPDITIDDLNDIQDILYLGYSYNDHNEIKWYLLSQYFLWDKLGYDMVIQNSAGVSIVDLFSDEYNEYLTLIKDFKVIPSYMENNIDINYNEQIILDDLNEVEEEFDFVKYAFIRIKEQDGNKYLYGTRPAKTYLEVYRINHPDNVNRVYYSGDMIYLSNRTFSKRYYRINVNIHGGKIKIINIDDKENLIPNTIYKLYNSKNNYIMSLKTDENGEAITSYLPYDDYYLVEDIISEKYVSNKDKIFFEFVDYGITEVIIKNALVKNDKAETDSSEIDDSYENIDESLKEDVKLDEDNKEVEKNREENVNEIEEEFADNLNTIEVSVPSTEMDLSKYVIISILLLFFCGLKVL